MKRGESAICASAVLVLLFGNIANIYTKKHQLPGFSQPQHHGAFSVPHNEWEGKNLKPILRQEARKFEDNVTIVQLPPQPDNMIQMLLSVVLSGNALTKELNLDILTCLSNTTNTKPILWGLYGADRFAPTLLQAEYFVQVEEHGFEQLPETVDRYIREGMLTACVRAASKRLSPIAALLEGRTVIAPRTSALVSSTGSTPAWLVGAVLGGVLLVGGIGVLTVSYKENELYEEKDYDQIEGFESGIDNMVVEAHMLGRRLYQVAGQREENVVLSV